MGQAAAALKFAAQLYQDRAVTAFHGHARHDPVALLRLAPGRDNPYPIYEQLRDRRTGVRPEGSAPDPTASACRSWR